ncbi:MAG: hypothetical protein NTV09_02515 [Bacteroidetes bacterium]|nr:hypothetical protein [Bacteroidota bacterium]
MKHIFLSLFLLVATMASAQDRIILINGDVLDVKNVELKDNKVSFQLLNKEKRKRINPDRVFSVQYATGAEQIVFEPDPLDPNDFKPEEMRLFIKGEQDAKLYYHNTGNKIVSAAVGAGAGLLSIYGLVVPALYSTVVGSFSPNVQKHNVSDPGLRDNLNYREGYERQCRERKIRNSLVYGFGGFVVGFAAFAIFLPNN